MRPYHFAPFAFVVIAIVSEFATAAVAEIPVGAPVDGIRCDSMEGSLVHIHQHVVIRDHGRAVTIPEDVGRPLVGQCYYWIHTHTPDGIIHVESPNFNSFTLGNFFDVWGQPLSRRNVAGAKPRPGEQVVVWVDGHRYSGDPRAIPLAAHLDVTIEVGPPYAKPAPFTQWNGL
jgi:hypothetical protein